MSLGRQVKIEEKAASYGVWPAPTNFGQRGDVVVDHVGEMDVVLLVGEPPAREELPLNYENWISGGRPDLAAWLKLDLTGDEVESSLLDSENTRVLVDLRYTVCPLVKEKVEEIAINVCLQQRDELPVIEVACHPAGGEDDPLELNTPSIHAGRGWNPTCHAKAASYISDGLRVSSLYLMPGHGQVMTQVQKQPGLKLVTGFHKCALCTWVFQAAARSLTCPARPSVRSCGVQGVQRPLIDALLWRVWMVKPGGKGMSWNKAVCWDATQGPCLPFSSGGRSQAEIPSADRHSPPSL